MRHVASADGTPIAYETLGSGADLVLIGTRRENTPIAERLAEHFRVTSYDQRGCGDSGDTQPYSVAREIEDLAAVLQLRQPPVGVFGVSVAGALGLEAAAAGLPIDAAAVYEVPYGIRTADEWHAYRRELVRLLDADRRGDAFALFMQTAGSTEAQISAARQSPYWPECEAIAHTRRYGAEVLGDDQVPLARFSRISCPVLALAGAHADDHMTLLPPDVFQQASRTIANTVQQAQQSRLDAVGHTPDPDLLTAELIPFFHASLDVG